MQAPAIIENGETAMMNFQTGDVFTQYDIATVGTYFAHGGNKCQAVDAARERIEDAANAEWKLS